MDAEWLKTRSVFQWLSIQVISFLIEMIFPSSSKIRKKMCNNMKKLKRKRICCAMYIICVFACILKLLFLF